MHLHDLLADLAGFDGAGVLETGGPRGSPDLVDVGAVDVRSVVHDSRGCPGGAVLLHPRRGHRRPPLTPPMRWRGAVALLVEEWLPLGVPQARVASVRGVLGPLAARFHGEPSFAMQVLGVTGTNGKTTTTYLLEAIAQAAGDQSGVIGTVGARIGDRALESAHTTPEATDLQAMLATMRDGGVATVAMEVSSHALDQHRVARTSLRRASPTSRTTTSTITARSRPTSKQGAPVHARVHGPRRGACRRPARRAARRRAAADGVVVTPTRDRERAAVTAGARRARTGRVDLRSGRVPRPFRARAYAARRRVQRRERARRRNYRAARRVRARRDRGRARTADRRARPDGAGRRGPGLHGVRRLRAHARRARRRARRGKGATAPGGQVIVVFGCGGDRDRAKRP